MAKGPNQWTGRGRTARLTNISVTEFEQHTIKQVLARHPGWSVADLLRAALVYSGVLPIESAPEGYDGEKLGR